MIGLIIVLEINIRDHCVGEDCFGISGTNGPDDDNDSLTTTLETLATGKGKAMAMLWDDLSL
jgi:hypothetical protein